MGLLKDHNAVTLVRLEPAASRSQVKHSTTEPLSHCARLCNCMNIYYAKGVNGHFLQV